MGHLTANGVYGELRRRLDKYPVGAPDSEQIYEILRLVFSEEEARLAAQMPMMPAGLKEISRRTGLDAATLQTRLEAMADKGLILDFDMRGKKYFMLPPTVLGFFEFSMMRRREDLDQKRLAGLFHGVLMDGPDFSSQFEQSESAPFRIRVHETALPEGTFTEILDYERATVMVETARQWSVALCHCRHTAHHLGADCTKFKMESCLSLNGGAEWSTRHGLARAIGKTEALDLLAEARAHGLVYSGDNVQHQPTFVCLCCGCCCGVLAAFKKFRPAEPAFSSNFQADIDPAACTGCGKCAKACPVGVIDQLDSPHAVGERTFKKLSKVDAAMCLGCGVCHGACQFGALAMKPRARRRITPETAAKRILSHAIDQGKLQHLILDDTQGFGLLAANRLLGAILSLPPAKQLLARQELKSRFVDRLLSRVKKSGVDV
jgi:ferredoxin